MSHSKILPQLKLLPTLLLLLATTAFGATAPTAPNDVAQHQARTEKRATALDALRKGDTARADALLREAALGTPNSAAWHRDFAELLQSAAIDLKDRDQYKRSTEYFHQAAAQLQSALAAKDAPTDGPTKAHIYQQLGFIARVADGDQAKANAFFKQAVEADATNAAARAGLQRTPTGRKDLDAVEKKTPTPAPGKSGG